MHMYVYYLHILSCYVLGDYLPLLLSNFVSHSEAPSQGVRDISAPVVSSNDINLMWMPPKLQNWNGILTNYTVGKCGGGIIWA